MALQGNLREFSVNDILQLLGTQRKTGCLTLESKGKNATLFVLDGRLVSTRTPGPPQDDPLLRFLMRARRLSNEQYRGILTIQQESNRDVEDLLVNGRYLEEEELSAYVERQMLDDLMRVSTWLDGSYAFDPNHRWPHPPLARMAVEGAMIEVARRVDEQRRFQGLFKDPHQLLGVHDLPDAEEHLSEEECELFGIIDGRHTVTEIVESAPLSEYEAYESLQRMHEAGWIEFAGRRDPGVPAAAAATPAPAVSAAASAARSRRNLLRELAVGGAVVLMAAVLGIGGRVLRATPSPAPERDGFSVAEMRNLRYALSLYHREQGHYPERLTQLVEDRWTVPHRLRVAGRLPRYQASADGSSYVLEPAR